jgi:hypothetical protein
VPEQGAPGRPEPPYRGGVTPEQVQALVAPEGAPLLEAAAAATAGGQDALSASSALRRAFPGADAGLVAAALGQAALRRQAAPRLGPDADRILLTRDGLEQATRSPVATLRAERLAGSARTVADLGCGIGTESWAMARAGMTVIAVERDPAMAAFARHNADALDLTDRITVIEGDVTDPTLLASVLERVDAVFLDPARRDPAAPRSTDGSTGRRILDPERWSPPWSFVRSLAERIVVVVKVAPGIDTDIAREAEITFTSHDGDLVEACVWFDPATMRDPHARGRRVAQVMRGNTLMSLVNDGLPDEAVSTSAPLAFLVDPDPAIVRAGALPMILQRGGALLDPRVAYVTRDEAPQAGERWLGIWYEVLDHMPFNVRTLRWRLTELGIGHVTITKRAFAGDVEEIRRQLRPSGTGRSATVVLTRTDAGPIAVICTLLART